MHALLNAVATLARPRDAQRLFHGRGGLHPGCAHWSLDCFDPVFLSTSHQPATADELAALHQALSRRWAELAPGEPLNWVHQGRHDGRSEARLMAGSVPDPHLVSEDGARFLVHLLRGQNHGLFLDMAAGRRWVRSLAASQPRLKVLNLFAYTCAFSVVARLAGAAHVTNLDMSHGALAIGQQNHHHNGLRDGVSFLAHDLFKTWGKVARGGPYGLVIADPPSHQVGSFVATKDYPRLIRRLPDLLLPGGRAMLCLNAPELGPEFLVDAVRDAAPALVFEQRLDNPASFADASASRALKVLVFRLPERPGQSDATADGLTHPLVVP